MDALLAAGEYQVGFHKEDLSYSDASFEMERSMNLLWWYPTEASSGDLPTYRSLTQPDAVWQEAPAASGSFPMLVSSHGSQGFAEGSSFLFEHFASHGWIVVAPDHTNNTLFDHRSRTNDIYLQRPLDISAVLDHTENLPANHPVLGHIGTPIVANGHSYGGYTLHALAGAEYDMAAIETSCSESDSGFCDGYTEIRQARFAQGLEEARIVAHISMAPGDFRYFGTQGIAAVETPVFLMTGELDESTGSDSEPTWDALVGEQHLRIHLLGGGHTSFTDYAGLFEDSEVGLDPEEGWRIIRGYALAFANLYAGDDTWDYLLREEATISESAVMMRK
jgi:predicted dienelactone hydrolase